MILSEAIRYGSTLRGESHSGPFTRIANTDELRSDVWGAACEAVYSLITKRNWNRANQLEYDSDIEALREIQQKYFSAYFRMPANCPGAQPRQYMTEGVRFVDRHGHVAREGEKQKIIKGITSDCPRILNLAEYVEHAFYVHNWSREQCAQAVEWYEQKSAPLIVQNFEHYQDLSVQQRTNQRLTAMMRRRERERYQRRQQRRAYFTG